ncbi:EF-hand domain-containing protein [Pseudoxanthomonas sp.]|uniref:EF-hand domain-containing protein n=1 Tax=Pseudoxanthomonas sp. TaxID=1871049 RepID=UPI002624C4DC|nr:EF-hand domain-containing protein [Pseudoxanthomonas sp.]WDS37506.1 MAG: EF-hand domain-containing protein [Pseudoxanthomonas sp.]
MKTLLRSGVLPGLLMLAGVTHAQSSMPTQSAETVAPPPASASNTLTSELPPQGFKTVTVQTPQGPVTVNWGQENTLANASDYKVTVEQLDKNGDGVITRDEVPENHALSSEFRLVDKNHDGKITAEELSQWR